MQRVFGRRLIINSTLSSINLLHNFSQLFFYSTSSSSSFSSLSLSSANHFVEYLVNSLGFSHQKAVTTSTKLSRSQKVNYSNLPKNAVSVVNLFKEHGFDDAHITKIVCDTPQLLTFRADETIKPKLGFLIDHGFSGFDLIKLVTKNPRILTRMVESLILPAIQVLTQFLDVDDALVVVKKSPYRCLNNLIKNLSPNVDFLKSHGVPIEWIMKLLIKQPTAFKLNHVKFKDLSLNVDFLTSYGVPVELITKHLIWQPRTFTLDHVKFKDIVIGVEKKTGVTPSSPMFLYGVHIFTGHSEEKIESKFQVLKSFGWTQGDVEALMMTNVNCFTLSDENIRKKLDFLMNVLQLEPAFVVRRIIFLTCSLEKRMLPRHDVMQILKAKGLLQRDVSFYSVIATSESCFVNTFVLPFEEVHQVYAKHTGRGVTSTTQERADNLQRND